MIHLINKLKKSILHSSAQVKRKEKIEVQQRGKESESSARLKVESIFDFDRPCVYRNWKNLLLSIYRASLDSRLMVMCLYLLSYLALICVCI